LYHIVSALRKSDSIESVHILEFVDESSVRLLKVKAGVTDGTLLYITEVHTSDYQKYSYHWQKTGGELIIRWDNKPHWRNIETFPHHKHQGDSVLASERIDIHEVLKVIQDRLERR